MKDILINTPKNKITGKIDKNGIRIFKGIPYARPPVGRLRWMAPEPEESVLEPVTAFEFGPSCIQPVDDNEPGSLLVQSEDCLYLNIWSRETELKKKPVMVFIHGGGFIGGGTADPVYSGYNFVRRSDIVLVTINYRVNVFGFMDLETLGGAEYSDSKNLGILDQIRALEWLRDNIDLFDGDSGNVTIFGESAGSASVSILMTVPRAKGLFHKVIAQSGCLNLLKKPGTAKKIAADFIKISGKSSIDDLVYASPDEISEWSETLQSEYGYGAEIMFAPVADGVLIPKDPYARIADGCASDISLVIGSNADEFRYWKLYYEDLDEIIFDWILENNRVANAAATADLSVTEIEPLFKEYSGLKKDLSEIDKSYEFANDFLFRMPNIKLAELQSRHSRVWMYFFTWKSRLDGIGAAHAVELAFVFHNLHYENYTGGDQPESLADNIQDAWTAFAGSGEPNHPGVPVWREYTEGRRSTMFIDEVWRLEDDPGRAERILLSQLYNLRRIKK